MRWRNRLQQHVAITGTECTVLLVAFVLFAAGQAVMHWQSRTQAVPENDYRELDLLFEQGSARLMHGVDTLARDAAFARLDLNAATAGELQLLPRVGPVMANRIIAYREANGPFESVRDLLGVRGIGEKTLAVLEPLLTVGGSE